MMSCLRHVRRARRQATPPGQARRGERRACRPALALGLAMALAAPSVMAQTGTPAGAPAAGPGVSVYGVVDLAIERISAAGAPGGRLVRMPGITGSVPSRLGFRGEEDLGGGLRALFVLEMGLGADTGTLNQGGRGFGRQSFAGVAGPWGTLTWGRQYTMLFWSLLDADILGPNTHSSGSLDAYLPNARADNALAWRGRFGGWALGATYSLGRDAVNAGPGPAGTNCPGEGQPDRRACRGWSLMVKHDGPHWGMAAAVDQLHGGPGAFGGLTAGHLTDRRSTLNGWVRVAGTRLGGGLIDRRNDGSPAAPRSRLWFVGASHALTPRLTLDGELFRLDQRHSANAATLLALRLSHALSKRTVLYASAGRVVNAGTLAMPVSNAAAGGAPLAGRAQNGLATGIRHSF